MNFIQSLAPDHVIASKVFLHLIFLNYLIAFASLYPQVIGLYGKKGLHSIDDLVSQFGKKDKLKHLAKFPSLFWFLSSDQVLKATLAAGILLSLTGLLGFFTPLTLLGCFLLYLSFMHLGGPFLAFQWDCLLLEVGFLAFLLSLMPTPSFFALTALWMVLFKLMFLSGAVKLLSADQVWRDQTALYYHYETQPLPNPLSHFFHNLPKFFHRLSCTVMFLIELIIPFFLFLPGKGHELAFFSFAFLQVMIILTGNYAYFNLLTLTLCIPLLTNDVFGAGPGQDLAGGGIVARGIDGIFLFLTLLNVLVVIEKMTGNRFIPPFFNFLRRLFLINSYGLFAVMTKKRCEIVIEGSLNGEVWEEYSFHWKVGNQNRIPSQVAPYQPRLDWQMWFAALTNKPPTWFRRLVYCLLENQNEVKALLKTCPFGDQAPKYIRANLYRYTFTNSKTLKETGDYWEREFIGNYMLPVKLYP